MLLRVKEIKEKYAIGHTSLLEWEKQGILEPHRTPGGHRRYLQSDIEKLLKLEGLTEVKPAIYARVSTKKQKDNLTRQIERLKEYCSEKAYTEVKEYSEVASGLNDRRRQLHKLIDAVIKREVNLIICEYKDRLSRFGINFLIHFFERLGCKLVFLEEKASKDENEELVGDVLALITSFSARLYGKRGGRKKLKKELGL